MKYAKANAFLIGLFAVALIFSLNPTFAANDQILTFTGLGPVQIGMTVAEAEIALGTKLTPMDPSNGIDTEACWITSRVDNIDSAIGYMVQNGKIVRIDVNLPYGKDNQVVVPAVSTERGIRLSSSVEDVKKAYGSDLLIEFHSQGDEGNYDQLYMTVLDRDKRHGLLFVNWKNNLTSMGSADVEVLELQEGCL